MLRLQVVMLLPVLLHAPHVTETSSQATSLQTVVKVTMPMGAELSSLIDGTDPFSHTLVISGASPQVKHMALQAQVQHHVSFIRCFTRLKNSIGTVARFT